MIHHRPQSFDENLSQCSYLIRSGVVGRSMVLSLSLPLNGGAAGAIECSTPNAFIRVDSDGKIAVIMPRVEVREGIYSLIRILISDELKVVPNCVDFEFAPKDAFVADAVFYVLATGNSVIVRGALKLLGELGATARVMLIAAAAKRWGVDTRSCHAHEGEVTHGPTSRKLRYGDLAIAAAFMPIPKPAAVKRVSGR